MKREKIWALVILVLIGLSAWVMLGTHYSKAAHSRVPLYPAKYGLDIKGGVRAVLQAQTDHLPAGVEWNPETRERVRTTLENRINASGVGEASVQPKGDNQYIIELPDVKNKDAILEQLGTTASMTFYYFRDVQYRNDPSPRTTGNPIIMDVTRDPKGHEVYSFFDKRNGQSFRDGGPIKADFTQLLGEGTGPRPGATAFTIPAPLSSAEVVTPPIYLTADQQTRVLSLNREYAAWKSIAPDAPNPLVILSGADILPQSQARMGGTLGSDPEVTQEFTPNGARAMSQFTREHAKEIMGIVLDDSVLSAPRIDGEIDDEGEISGGFQNLSEAVSLANLLNAGALPVPLQQVEVQSIEASLGTGAVHKSVVAGGVGLVLVLLFMLIYYRLPGLVADIALIIYALFTLALFRVGLTWLGIPVPGITLTLPGIAGFILSIGMAVDANILIFERMKEELRSGKSLRSSIDAGFRRAFSAIRDSNICTAITCIVLLSMGTPSVKGFATTLLLGVIVSLFSAITVTRTLLYLLVDAGIGNSPKLFGLNVGSRIGQTSATDAAGDHAPRNIIGRRKVFYALSALIIVPGLIFWLGLHGLKKSIEFTGGSQIEVRYAHSVAQSAVEKAVMDGGFKTPTPHVQMANGGTDAIVSVAQQSSVANPTLNPIHQRLVTALNTVGPNTEQQFGNVGGVISAELTRNAFQAVVIAAILITLYLATVFGIGGFVAGLRLGASAIAALLHDVLVLLGAFAIFGYFLGWEIDSLFVTAMLTVIGFSVHDTVVIFDRVRENLRHKARGEAFEPLVNRSINQTLSRSVNTSLTVLMTLLALIILGGQTTRQLNWALFIGILSGTYSSIFNAASILVDWENWLAKRPRPSGTAAAYSGGTAEGSTAAVLPNGGTSRPFTPRSEPTVSSAPGRPKSTSSVGTGTGTETTGVRPKKKKPARRF